MSTNHTANYNLSQWEKTDKVLMEDFNADNAKIDAALKAEADARAAADKTINTALGKKAEKTALTALQNSLNSEISSRESAVETLTGQGQLHTILSHTQSESTTQIKLDLSGISWSQWRRVYLFVTAKGTGTSRAGFNDMVNVFGMSNNGDRLCLIMFPMYSSSLKISGFLTGSETILVKSSNTYGALKNLEITCDSGGTIAAGFKVVLQGEK